jgi:hypothetical protein
MKINSINIVNLIVLSVFLVVFTCLTPIAKAQEGSVKKSNCSIEITSLKEGDKVGQSVTIRGKATIPAGGNFWILVRKRSMQNQWWPQAGPIELDRTGEWEAEAFFGRPEDVGSNFEVAAVVVSHETSATLIKWFSTAKAHDYPPMPFPDTNSACSIVTIKVMKVR